jgi:tetratricopeptide (TPR) repeat protein
MKKNILILLLLTIVKVEAQTSTFAVSDSLFAKGRYQLALAALDKKEDSFLANYKKAVIYESIDNFKKAAYYFEKALTFKEDEKASLKLAKNYRALSLSKKAIPIYEALLEKDSLNLVLKYQLGKMYVINKKPKNAVKTFTYLVKNDEKNANYSYYLGLSYALNGQRDPMINSFIATYTKDTTHFRAISRLAKSFQKLNDKDSTQLFVDKGLALRKNDIDLNKLKINQLYKDEQYLEAIPLLKNLDTIDKKETYSMAMLGRVYYNLDSLAQAKKVFTKLSFTDREDFKALTYLGDIYFKEKNYDRAMMNYIMATTRGKEKRDAEFYGLARVFYEKEKPKMAIKYFEKAYEENSSNYRALYQLATMSDDYYKDKKIAYRLYNEYIEKFWRKDEGMNNFVRNRISEIKKAYFMKGETLK